jgi:hypothetical protein
MLTLTLSLTPGAAAPQEASRFRKLGPHMTVLYY